MQRIVVVAARGPVYRKLVVAAALVATGIALERSCSSDPSVRSANGW